MIPPVTKTGIAPAVGPDKPLRAISSMATRRVLAELATAYQALSGVRIALESVGGIDAAKRVAAGEDFDLVILARDAIDELSAAGHLLPASVLDIVRSGVAAAVPAGASRPAIDSEEALRRAVLAARTIGYSTGPSGVQLARLFERWGIAESVRARIVTPPPGVPVGTLVASGAIELGFQQLSELLPVDGIQILGPLPASIQIETTFSGAVGAHGRRPEAAGAALTFLASAAAAEAKRRQGMEPADGAGGGVTP